jgi:phosphatidylethanolamine-binding protein (PEBP) family uncharacterized protein
MSEFALESSAFQDAQAIPSRHGCEGDDVSPQLHWTNVPDGTRLELGSGAAKAELEQAIQGHVLTTAELVGTYER